MNNKVNERYTLASSFLRQYDSLLQTEIGARYAFEMTTRTNARNRDRLEEARLALTNAELNKELFATVIEDITGLPVEALRTAVTKLETTMQRLFEVETELYKLTLLSTTLKTALESLDVQTETTTTAISELTERLAEIPQVEKHMVELTAVVESLAETIGYRKISEIATSPLISI